MTASVAETRRVVLSRAMRAPSTLADAIATLGFVQADPIRAPARAQDLILRHRVHDYRAGDLERRYPELALDEGFVYAYGFVPPATQALLHPRVGAAPRGLARRVLDHVAEHGPTHPRALATALGTRREVNAWGGQSLATTRALERLHYMGHLRVARRDRGVRVYGIAARPDDPLPPDERLRRLTLAMLEMFGPISESSFRSVLRLLRHALPKVPGRDRVVARLVAERAVVRRDVEGVSCLWTPAAIDERPRDRADELRFLAPFDPIVWERGRVEHLWEWAYRFEAYTPVAKRQFGYYALPILWRDALIGWANVSSPDGELAIELGFVERRPRDRAFTNALDAEVERLRWFLTPAADAP